MEGVTYTLLFTILVSILSGQAVVLSPQYSTQTDFVNYQVTLLPQNLQLVGMGDLQLQYKAYVSEYFYFTDNSITDKLLEFYNMYAYSLFDLDCDSVSELVKRLSSANYPVFPVTAIAFENVPGIIQDLKLVRLFYIVIDNNKYLVIPYTSEKYLMLPIVSGEDLFEVSLVTDRGIMDANYSSVVESVEIVLDDVGIEESFSEKDVTISGSYTKNGIASVEVNNPNDYYVVVTLFKHKGGKDKYITFYVPPSSSKHLNLDFIPSHAVVWKGFRPRVYKLSLSYTPIVYMYAEKTEYYEGETVKIKLTKGVVKDYDIHVTNTATNEKLKIYYPSSMSNYFMFQAPDVDPFSESVLRIVLQDRETGLIVESMYITVKSRLSVKNVHVDLEKGVASVTLSEPLADRGYTVDVTTEVCSVFSGECGVKRKALSSFDLEEPTITAEISSNVLQIGYNKITVTLQLTDPIGKSVKYSQTLYKYVSPELFINDIKLSYNFLSGSEEVLYNGGEVSLEVNVNNDLVSKDKRLFVTIYANNEPIFSEEIDDDISKKIQIKHTDNYLLVSVYVNNIQVYNEFYLTKPKPIHILLIQNSWLFVLAILIVGLMLYRQRQKHPEMKLMRKYDVRKANEQIIEYLRRKVVEKIGADAQSVLFVYDVGNNTYISGWVSQFTRRAYLIVTDVMLNIMFETDLPIEELFKVMTKINQGASPFEVAVDTYNTVKASEIQEFAKEVHKDLYKPKTGSIDMEIPDLGSVSSGEIKPPAESESEEEKGGFIDKLDNIFSEPIGQDSMVETSEEKFDLDIPLDKRKKENEEEDLNLDLDLDLDLDLSL